MGSEMCIRDSSHICITVSVLLLTIVTLTNGAVTLLSRLSARTLQCSLHWATALSLESRAQTPKCGTRSTSPTSHDVQPKGCFTHLLYLT